MFGRKFEIWKGWIRYTRRQKLQTLISVIGLSVGMVCFALSALWLRYIESFERFVPDAERVYLLGAKETPFSNHNVSYRSFTPQKAEMLSDFPEIERIAYAKSCELYLFPDRLRLDDGPIRELYSKYSQEIESIKLDYIRLFMFLGLLVIVCALCNYLFTMISNMHIRARSISLHRLLGASKGQLVLLNVFDTLLILILSSVVGIALILLLMPVFKEYSKIHLPASVIYTDLSLYIGAVVVVCVACSSLTTLTVLKSGNKAILQGRMSHRASRKIDSISNVLQLTFSMIIMICVAVMLLQIRYLTHTTALGFERDNLVAFTSLTDCLEQKIKSSPLVEDYIVDIGFVYPKTSAVTQKVWLNDSRCRS